MNWVIRFSAGAVVAVPYETGAVHFDGTNDFIQRDGDLTGNANSKVGLVSWWVKMTGGDGLEQVLYKSQNGRFKIIRDAANTITITGKNAANTTILLLKTVNEYTTADGWFHLLAAWDLANTVGQLYMTDVDDLAASPTLTDDTIEYISNDHGIGATS